MLRSSLVALFLLLSLPLMAEEEKREEGCPITVEKVPLSLEEAERFALIRNQLVRIAEQEVVGRGYTRQVAIAAWLPQITYTALVDHFERIPYPTVPTKDYYINKLGFDQVLFSNDDFFNVGITTVQLQEECVRLAERQNDLLLELRRRYFQVSLDRDNVLSARQNLHTLLQSLIQQQDGVRIGTSTKLDVAQAEASYYQGMTSYYETINQLRQSENNFMETLGVSPDCTTFYTVGESALPVMETADLKALIALADAYSQAEQQKYVETGKLPEAWLEGRMPGAVKLFSQQEIAYWTTLAMRLRPPVLGARLVLKEAELEVSQAKGRYLPEVGFFAAYQANPIAGNAPRFDKNVWWNGGFALSWTIFDGTGRESKFCRSKAREKAACLELERQIITSDTDVRNFINDLVAAAFEYSAAVRGVEAAALSVDLGYKARAIGLMTTLDYLILVNDLFQAEVTRNQAGFNILDAYYSLRHAVGIDVPLWKSCGVPE